MAANTNDFSFGAAIAAGFAVKAVSFTKDGRLISGSEDDMARIWRLDRETPPQGGPPLRTWLLAHSNVEIRGPKGAN